MASVLLEWMGNSHFIISLLSPELSSIPLAIPEIFPLVPQGYYAPYVTGHSSVSEGACLGLPDISLRLYPGTLGL